MGTLRLIPKGRSASGLMVPRATGLSHDASPKTWDRSRLRSGRSSVVTPGPSLLVPGHGDVSFVIVLSLLDRRDAVDDRLVSELQLPRGRGRRARSFAPLQDALGRRRLSVGVRWLLGRREAALIQAGVASRGAAGRWRDWGAR